MARGTGKGCEQGSAQPRSQVRAVAEPFASIAIEQLFHVGTLNPADKGKTGYARSWEGHGLSVSPCPAAWERIARLGGNPWFALDCADGHFLDVNALSADERQQVADWAVANGFARLEPCFTVSHFAEEVDDDVTASFASRRDAIEEAVEVFAIDHSGVPSLRQLADMVEREETLVSEASLDALIGFKGGAGCFDFCLIAYVQTELSELDGLYWYADYGYLSAPRAVILPSRLDRWTRRQLDDQERSELEEIGDDAFG